MKIFILSEFKLQELEKEEPSVEFIAEDLIDIFRSSKTCVLGDREFAIKKFEEDLNLHYLYEIDLVRRLVP